MVRQHQVHDVQPTLRLLGIDDTSNRCNVFAVRIPGLSSYELSDLLEQRYGLLTRPGLHCAPLAHQTFGTHPNQDGSGATRFSFGPFTTVQHVQAALDGLNEICAERAPLAAF